MDRNKIKFKYLLNVWKSLPEYPTKEDVAYEIAVYMIKDGRNKGDISLQTFNSIYGSTWEKTKHGEVIRMMIADNDLIESEKSTPSKKWFKLDPKYSFI
jgi:hypothetical protein